MFSKNDRSWEMRFRGDDLLYLLEDCLEELEYASDFYGEGPPPIDEDLISDIKNKINSLTNNK